LGKIDASGLDSVKISNITNCATSFELTIDACVDMKFVVEFIERDWTHTDKKMSQEVRYKTEAIPEFVDKNVTNFHLSYAFNPIIGSQVLDKASIKFPKRILKHANCIKHIEISGKKDNSGAFRQQFTRNPKERNLYEDVISRGGSYNNHGSYNGGSSSSRSVPWYSAAQGNWNPGGIPGGSSFNHGGNPGGSSFNPGGNPGGSSFNSGGNLGGSSFNPGGNPGGSSFNSGGNPGGSSFNPGGNHGGSSFNPGGNHGGSSYNPSRNPGGSSYNPGGGSYNPGRNPGGSSYNPGGNPGGSSFNPGENPGGSSFNPGGNPGGSSFNPGGNPGEGTSGHNFGRNSRTFDQQEWISRSRQSKSIEDNRPIMKTPPFFGNHNEIELLVDVDPCQAYKFDLKIVSQQGRTLGEIKDLYLPKLSQMSDFRPPKLSKMFIIERTIPLKLKLAPEFGDSNKISESCMKDFLHAVDNHIHVLEQDVKFHVEEEKLTHRKLYHSEMKMINNLGQIMRGYGNCTCNSSLIKIDGTRSSSLKKYMGPYQLAGVHQNMPYYVQANLGSNNQTMNQDQVRGFLYFDPNSQWKWNIGLKLTNLGQNGEIKFRTKNFRVEECPGDDGNLKRWDYSGTLSWKHDPGLSIKCLN